MKETKWTRVVSGLLALVFMLGSVPTAVFAAADETGLCAHHEAHTDCGYEADISNCGFVCDICGSDRDESEPEETEPEETEPEESEPEESEPEESEPEESEPEESEPEESEPEESEPEESEPEESEPEESEPEESEPEESEPEESEPEESEPEETEPVAADPVFQTVTETFVPDVDLPDSEDLFSCFVERELYSYDATTFGTAARANLSATEQAIYDALKNKIEAVAVSGGSTQFVLSGIDGIKTSWTNTELGVSSIEDTTIVESAFSGQFTWQNAATALLADCPFDLYWYDKTVGVKISYGVRRSGVRNGSQTIWTTAEITDWTFTFPVSSDYASGANLVTTNVARVTTARTKAAQVVAQNAGKSDYEKLVAYKNYICDQVAYNDAAADNDNTPYGDPWQLISVFDGDFTTNVVCEGYSKAFQYLCDLSGLDCISVSGTMSSSTGSGAHMWNVVTLDGSNYLVDVTNTDTGTVGQGGELFLAGGTYKNGGYSFSCGYQTVVFTCSDLGLAATNYTYQPPIATYSVTVADSENGIVTADPTNAAAGTEIQLTVTPDAGYVLDTLTVTWSDDQVIEVTDSKFTMPAGDVTVVAVFKEEPAVVMGTVNADNLNVRSAPSSTADILKRLAINTRIKILELRTVDGVNWGRIAEGWVNLNFVTIYEPNVTGTCGDNLTWELDTEGVLTISGTGDMYGYDDFWDIPWYTYCEDIKNVTIEDGITSIGAHAFAQLENLTDISIPDSVTIIKDYAFWMCGIENIDIPDGVETIGHGAFSNCSNLSGVQIPNSVTSINDFAFYGCINLQEVAIPASVSYIGVWALGWCESLTNIFVDSRNTVYCDQNGVLFSADMKELLVYPAGKTGNYTIPSTVTRLGDYSFESVQMDLFTIPASVNSLGMSVFAKSSISFSVDANNTAFSSGPHSELISKDKKTLYYCANMQGQTEYHVPDGVTVIASAALSNDNFVNVVFPDSVKILGSWAFDGAGGLKCVTFGKGLEKIDECAFQLCSDLEEVYFTGDAPTFAGDKDYTFIGTTVTAYYPAGNETWTDDVMQNYGGTITWKSYGASEVAQNGTAKYETLQAAISAASAGDVITLLADIDEIVGINRPLTIMANGFSLNEDNIFCGKYLNEKGEKVQLTLKDISGGYVITTITSSGQDEGDAAAYIDGQETLLPLQAALDEAEKLYKAQTGTKTNVVVKLSGDISVNSIVVIPSGVTLNIGAHTLSVRSLIGVEGSYLTATSIANNGTGDYGILKAAKKNVILPETALVETSTKDYSVTVLPVWNPDAAHYEFCRFILWHNATKAMGLEVDEEKEHIKFVFRHQNSTYYQTHLLNESGANSGLRVVLEISWKVLDEDGGILGTPYQAFVYTDKHFTTVAPGGYNYTFNLHGYSAMFLDLDTMLIQTKVISDTGAIAYGKPIDYSFDKLA